MAVGEGVASDYCGSVEYEEVVLGCVWAEIVGAGEAVVDCVVVECDEGSGGTADVGYVVKVCEGIVLVC